MLFIDNRKGGRRGEGGGGVQGRRHACLYMFKTLGLNEPIRLAFAEPSATHWGVEVRRSLVLQLVRQRVNLEAVQPKTESKHQHSISSQTYHGF